jgi:hypothetical protein
MDIVSHLTSIFIHQVDTFFAVGSPLGVFLALRNIRIGIGKSKHMYGFKMLLYMGLRISFIVPESCYIFEEIFHS